MVTKFDMAFTSRKTYLILAAALLAFATLSCGGKTPLSGENKAYAGKWVAADGTFVHIYLNGGGDFKLSNSNVTGGSATFTDSTLTIGFGPIKKEFSIDQPPTESENGMSIVLDGIEYVKSTP